MTEIINQLFIFATWGEIDLMANGMIKPLDIGHLLIIAGFIFLDLVIIKLVKGAIFD